MINILFIHQSSELYGSDKTLLLLLQNIDRNKYFPIVILPCNGPLKEKLEEKNIEVKIAPVLKLHRKMFSPKNIFLFFSQIKSGIKTLDALNEIYHFDIVYSNTLAVLLGIIYASRKKIKHIWHVHEIIESPVTFKKAFQKLLSLKGNTAIVCNSLATQKFWDVNSKISSKSMTILNGQELTAGDISDVEIQKIRKELFDSENQIIIALIGRISRWKGQSVLLDAYIKLAITHKNIKLIFVGSAPPNQELFLENLQNNVLKYNLQHKVKIIPFQRDISKIWKSIDIAVVPSIEPEPFGLVALEAMLAKKPVVASDHGGLSEIVRHNETGFLVKPNDSEELAEALEKLVKSLELRNHFGQNGYKRATEEFSVYNYVENLENLFSKIITKAKNNASV
ncbi:MAG TPA: glycosyltransferase family 4 protein [Flavobacterium sp.]|nr:glycosyltransferase family 4 protein [Flavobacterium sp.]